MNHALSPREPGLSWYRYPLVWLVILIPLASVIAGMITLTLAIRNADATVADDWYKQGKAINRSMADLDQAHRLGITMALFSGDQPSLRLSSTIALPWPEQLDLAFRHPAFAERDFSVTFHHQGNGLYRADQALAAGQQWIVTVTPVRGHWRLRERVQLGDAP